MNSHARSDLQTLVSEHPTFIPQLRQAVKRYYQSPEHRIEFERWYLAKYGIPYVWKDEPPR